ncbi:RICIN domain-containing protein [Streptomyces sp. NPDC098101]|uniref:RICIN domain-containing protein n=1 Tax=Streptomyces sp. NPDC098101 TaxID=3366096 RepID=UPI00381E653D
MRIGAIVGVTAALVLPLASPASAAVPPEDSIVLLKESFTEKCLDSNGGGSVYTGGCDSDNDYQKWQWIPRGSGKVILRDVATDRCLDSGGKSVYTSNCSVNNFHLQWLYRENDNGHLELKNVATGLCLLANIDSEVKTVTCNDLNYDWVPTVVAE